MLRILILEDETLIAMMLADWLEEMGHHPVGPAATAEEALALVATGIDAALLDLHLRDGTSYPIATRLKSHGIPFAFASGDGGHGLEAAFRDSTMLAKPYTFEELETVLGMWGNRV